MAIIPIVVKTDRNIFPVFFLQKGVKAFLTPTTPWLENVSGDDETPIEIVTSEDARGTTLVVDFAFDALSIIEYSLNADVASPTWVTFNEGVAIPALSGQSRYIRVFNGTVFNLRAQQAGNLEYLIVGKV